MSDELMELPEGWEWAKLGDILSILSGEAFKKKDYSASGVKLLQIANVSFGKVIWEQQNFLPEEFLSKYPELVLEKGDIVMALNRPILNGLLKIACLKEDDAPAVLYQRVARFNLILNEMREYFFNYTGSPLFLQLIRNNLQGSDQPYINTSTLPAFLIPLPPLNEQKRIVAAIEALRERSQKARSALSAIPELCDKFRQSVLCAAFRGDLTADWREQNPDVEPASVLLERLKESNQIAKVRRGVPEKVAESEIVRDWTIPETWTSASTAELLRCGVFVDLKDGNHGGSHPKTSEFTSDGLPFITAAQVKDFSIDYDGANKISGEPLKKLRVGFAKPKDVIYTHKGSVGRVAIADRECILTPQTTYYRVAKDILYNRYLMWYLSCPNFTEQVDSIKSQTTRDFVPITEQYLLFHCLPPLEEQIEIVKCIESLFEAIGTVSKQHIDSVSQLTQFDRSILAKAFRGELVEQDPNDEPASVLLKRIRVDREQQAQGKAKKLGKKAAGNKL